MSTGKAQVPKNIPHYIEIVMGGSQRMAQSCIDIATDPDSQVFGEISMNEIMCLWHLRFNSCFTPKRKGLMRLGQSSRSVKSCDQFGLTVRVPEV